MNRREALKNSALLSGYAFSAGTIAAILSGCNADVSDPVWKPSFVSMKQNDMLIKLVDTILPKSDTPSASEVGVHRFIDELLSRYSTEEEKTNFTTGLDKVLTTNPEDMVAYLTQIAQEAKGIDEVKAKGVRKYKSKEFFTQLRALTMTGYYTSEEIGTEVLVYDPIPGDYIGCYPLEKTGGRAWAI